MENKMTDPKKSKVLVADDDEISAAYLGIFPEENGF